MYLSNKQIPEKIAEKIYNILVEHTGMYNSESEKRQFLFNQGKNPSKYNKQGGCVEYRFGGKLGFGGKFRNCNNRFYVSAYNEDEGSKEAIIIRKVNELLKPLYVDFLRSKCNLIIGGSKGYILSKKDKIKFNFHLNRNHILAKYAPINLSNCENYNYI
jgi:hypothetical protein